MRAFPPVAGRSLGGVAIPPTLTRFVDEVLADATPSWQFKLERIAESAVLLAARGPLRRSLVLDAARMMVALQGCLHGRNTFSSADADLRLHSALRALFTSLTRTHEDYGEAEVVELLKVAHQERAWFAISSAAIVSIAERFVVAHGRPAGVVAALESLHKYIEAGQRPLTADTRKLLGRLASLAGGPEQTIPLAAGEPWSDEVIGLLHTLEAADKHAWIALLRAAAKASGTTPSGKYLRSARALIEPIGVDTFGGHVRSWMDTAGTRGRRTPAPMGGAGEIEAGLDPGNASVLKGLVWAAVALEDVSWAVPLGDLAERCYKKLPWFGPRCAKLGNACVAALSLLTGDAPAEQLARLKQRVKQPTGRRMTEKALGQFAQRSGLSIEQVEERGVPNLGLASDGTRTDRFGQVTALTTIADGIDAKVRWLGDDGKPRKAPPASVKADHRDALRELQAVHKQSKVALAAQRARLDQLLLGQRSWPYSAWRPLYIEQPVVGVLARRLIWTIDQTPALSVEGRMLDVEGKVIDPSPDAVVGIWHPAMRPADEVRAWRSRLEALGVTQPFKQAHREIYLLTDAERRTATYSNRFAAHVLRQHQFAALCQQRGWTYRLQGGFDGGGGHPTLALPGWNLTAEFWVNTDHHDDNDMSGSGIFLHVSTDQLRFYGPDRSAPLDLEAVPPLVFSEILRDVDLFVGVASVGNDPTWQDGGPDGRFRDYWHQYSFGDLGETARTRKAVLESLLPRLTKLKDRWTLNEKFLVVRGDIRTYKIHLGSGNILMEPNDQYLCIVPDRSSRGGTEVLLPFEGDATLSIILSKAFMLAADRKITDPTITRQIGG